MILISMQLLVKAKQIITEIQIINQIPMAEIKYIKLYS
jgi:hypothetical protein